MSIYKCPKCGSEVERTQNICPTCKEKLYKTKHYTVYGYKGNLFLDVFPLIFLFLYSLLNTIGYGISKSMGAKVGLPLAGSILLLIATIISIIVSLASDNETSFIPVYLVGFALNGLLSLIYLFIGGFIFQGVWGITGVIYYIALIILIIKFENDNPAKKIILIVFSAQILISSIISLAAISPGYREIMAHKYYYDDLILHYYHLIISSSVFLMFFSIASLVYALASFGKSDQISKTFLGIVKNDENTTIQQPSLAMNVEIPTVIKEFPNDDELIKQTETPIPMSETECINSVKTDSKHQEFGSKVIYKQPLVSSLPIFQENVLKLKTLKELLDSKILTQEEFDEKKKEILSNIH